MKYNAEQVAFMLHEAIDQNCEYKSWHCSTQHLMALVERVVAEEREACAKLLETTDLGGLKDNPAMQSWVAEMLLAYVKAIRARGQA